MPFGEAAASRERPSSTRAIAKRRRTHPPSLVLAARHHPKITRRKLKPRNLNRLAHGQISCASCQGSHRIEQQAIREGAESQALWALVYPAYLKTRKSAGSMTRKLSVTESHRVRQFCGTSWVRKVIAR